MDTRVHQRQKRMDNVFLEENLMELAQLPNCFWICLHFASASMEGLTDFFLESWITKHSQHLHFHGSTFIGHCELPLG